MRVHMRVCVKYAFLCECVNLIYMTHLLDEKKMSLTHPSPLLVLRELIDADCVCVCIFCSCRYDTGIQRCVCVHKS